MKRYISLLMIGLLSFMMTATVSCDRTESPVETKQEISEKIDLQAFEEQLAKHEFFMSWVEEVDPYVTKNKDNTFSVGWTAFYANHSNLDSKDEEIIEQLKSCVQIANETVMNNGSLKSPSENQSIWTNYYWWGKRTCFTGNHALDYAYWFSTLTWGGFFLGMIPYAILKAYARVCKWLVGACGGFCLVCSWAGGIWITCP